LFDGPVLGDNRTDLLQRIPTIQSNTYENFSEHKSQQSRRSSKLKKKKINSILKITDYITNCKFNNESFQRNNYRKIFENNHYNAFKVINNSNKPINMINNKTIINPLDFQDLNKSSEKKLLKPKPIYPGETNDYEITHLNKKRERIISESDEEELIHEIKPTKKFRDEISRKSVISSSISNINNLRNSFREEVSLNTMNNILNNLNTHTEEKKEVGIKSLTENKLNTTQQSSQSYNQKSLEQIKNEILVKKKINEGIKEALNSNQRLSFSPKEDLQRQPMDSRRRNLQEYFKEKEINSKRLDSISKNPSFPNRILEPKTINFEKKEEDRKTDNFTFIKPSNVHTSTIELNRNLPKFSNNTTPEFAKITQPPLNQYSKISVFNFKESGIKNVEANSTSNSIKIKTSESISTKPELKPEMNQTVSNLFEKKSINNINSINISNTSILNQPQGICNLNILIYSCTIC
jgi:hypothetical protein